jgi:hypothetical protein
VDVGFFRWFSKDQLIAQKAEMNLTGKMEKGKIQEVHTWDVIRCLLHLNLKKGKIEDFRE